MTLNSLFASLPLWGMCLVAMLVVLAALGVGVLLGRARRGSSDPSIGSVVAATLGLLAFMLAFTFNTTGERFTERKALLLEEVNAIDTAYLRADFLDARSCATARRLLADYARLRDFDPTAIAAEDYVQLLQRSKAIHAALWDLVAREATGGSDPARLRAFYEPLNEVIDYHTRRELVGGRYQIPTPIWVALYTITALAMLGIGFQLGASRSGSLLVALALAAAFSLVILLIADLDRGYEGFLTVNQEPMAELSRELQERERQRAPPPGG